MDDLEMTFNLSLSREKTRAERHVTPAAPRLDTKVSPHTFV
jgi:hypothetical protein